MACSPEQARLNGKLSKGPVTQRGKVIAAKNATKHGLLSTKPPILVTEDLETFEGLMQGLVDYYQPTNPVQWHLTGQIAMGMLRQHRLWVAEAAIANLAILNPPILDDPYSEWELSCVDYGIKTEYHQDNLNAEYNLLTQIIELISSESIQSKTEFLDEWGEHLLSILEKLRNHPTNPIRLKMQEYMGLSGELLNTKYQEICQNFSEDIYEKLYDKAFWVQIESMWSALKVSQSVGDFTSVRNLMNKGLFPICCSERLKFLNKVKTEKAQARQSYQDQLLAYREAILLSKVNCVDLAKLSKYEAHINRQLTLAIERLEVIRQQQQND